MTPMEQVPGARSNGRHRRRVTISDVAREVGITKGTVSRALNGYDDIAYDTRLRVTRAAERLGYRPLSHAQAIRTGRTRALGLVLQIDSNDSARPFLAEFIAGVTQAASAHNWSVSIAAEASEDAVVAAMTRLTDEQKADGFILPRTRRNDLRVDMLRSEGIPFVMFGRTGDNTACAWHDIDGEAAMQAATQRLAALGHTRIAHIPGGSDFTYSHLRIAGYKAGLHEAGLPVDPALIGPEATTRRAGCAAAHALLNLEQPPTAIVCATDRAALGVYRAAEQRGLSIGRELSVIAYDGIPESAFATPGLTTFAVDSHASGARLANLLIERIRGAAPEDLRELAPAMLVERGSDRAPTLTSDALARHLSDQTELQNVQWEDRE